MNQQLFRQFADIAYARAGIRLNDGKESLVSARIAKRIRALGLGSDREYLEFLQADESGEELVQFLDVISTNFTFFLREPDHFDLLAAHLRACVDEGRRELTIWSAASSTGEEPYSLAITALEALEGSGARVRILATDISTRVLATAGRGVYDAARLEKLSRAQRAKYFERLQTPDGEESYVVRPEVRKLLVFQRLNLARPPFPMKGPFDAIFCRNVMIYFDAPVRQGLVREFERLLGPGDPLMIGHSESLTGLQTRLLTIQPSVYRRTVAKAAEPETCGSRA
ncbi:MAG: CheR family methyltransferase [Candidatus Krumholzibacteriia bacterium]